MQGISIPQKVLTCAGNVDECEPMPDRVSLPPDCSRAVMRALARANCVTV